MTDAMWTPEAREAARDAIHAKRYTRLGMDVEPMDNTDARYCGSLADAALAALAPFVAAREAAAFQRGAEAMRSDAADYVAECMAALGLPLGVQSIRDLPIPEDKP